jgi:dihydroorotate dehydrogenase
MLEYSALESSLEKIKPWMWVPPAISHEWMDPLLKSLSFFDESLNQNNQSWKTWQPFDWRGLHFRNPMGIAGGVDKTASNIQNWWDLGVGFVEVGTITPIFQSPNPGKIIDRDSKNFSLWNKMGFPHPGYKDSLVNLAAHFENRKTPVLVNIGKNRWVTNDKAHEDYVFLIHQLHAFTDIFVVNISSPNTTGLRELFQRDKLKPFLASIYEAAKIYAKPVLLKLSPDEDPANLNLVIDISLEVGIDGFIVTNTTTKRDSSLAFPTDGGVSGKFLAPLSKQALKLLVQKLGVHKKEKLIINAGGIFNYSDLEERQALGADLFQIYSGIVFNGPYIFKKIAREHFLKYT